MTTIDELIAQASPGGFCLYLEKVAEKMGDKTACRFSLEELKRFYVAGYHHVRLAEIINGKNLIDLKRGTQILYIPEHAAGNEAHPDVQAGFVTSVRRQAAFCRYWKENLVDLRTKSCSERTEFEDLVVKDSVPVQQVVDALMSIEEI